MIVPLAATRTDTAMLEAPARNDDPIGVYIHIPFCAHICPYCDFNTYANQASRIPQYVEAASHEMEWWSSKFWGRTAASIFIGGGTPSLLEPRQIGSLIDSCRNNFDVSADVEISIEANPNDLSEAYCADLLETGANRLSIGAQTLDRRGLRVLGRLHEAAQIGTALEAARAAGVTNVSLDFIYGWPGQTIEQWHADLESILEGDIGGTRPDHLSLYGLIVEPGTPMADAVHRGILSPVDDDLSADFYELAIKMLASAGWLHYEIANWCAEPEKSSIHNSVYWRNGEYAGIGAGAHGHVAGRRIMNQPSPARYCHAALLGKSPATNVETIGLETAMSETMMLGLRLLRAGVSLGAFADRHGISLIEQFGTQVTKLASLGLLSVDSDRVRLTSRGTLLANSVCAEFL